MRKIKIKTNDSKVDLDVEFFDNPAGKKILKSLPIRSEARTWGEEIYFNIGTSLPDEGATMQVDIGDVAYWPEGNCLCIFFGKTPISSGEKPVPASEVVIVGKAAIDTEMLRKVKNGSSVIIE